MTGKLKDLTFARGGEQLLTISINADYREQFDALADGEVDVEIRKHRKARSLDANAYCWVLIDRLAAALKMDREDVYREAIRSIGGVSETVCVKETAFPKLCEVWCGRGIGFQVEKMPSKIPGCVNAVLFYGSSLYDAAQMSALIDHVVQDCAACGIETATPEELQNMKSMWANAPEVKNVTQSQ